MGFSVLGRGGGSGIFRRAPGSDAFLAPANSDKIVANRVLPALLEAAFRIYLVCEPLRKVFPCAALRRLAIPGKGFAQGSSGLRLKSLEIKVLKAGTCILPDKALVLICLLLQVRFPRAR